MMALITSGCASIDGFGDAIAGEIEQLDALKDRCVMPSHHAITSCHHIMPSYCKQAPPPWPAPHEGATHPCPGLLACSHDRLHGGGCRRKKLRDSFREADADGSGDTQTTTTSEHNQCYDQMRLASALQERPLSTRVCGHRWNFSAGAAQALD